MFLAATELFIGHATHFTEMFKAMPHRNRAEGRLPPWIGYRLSLEGFGLALAPSVAGAPLHEAVFNCWG